MRKFWGSYRKSAPGHRPALAALAYFWRRRDCENGVLSVRLALPKYLALGLLAIAALSLPPLELPQRLDRALYDLWTRLAPPPAPSNFLLVEIDGPGELEALTSLARREQAELLVTALEHSPAPHPDGQPPLLGPIAIASPRMPILRATDWHDGGYLWPRLDLGGVIRFEHPTLADAAATPSLAYAAARRLDFAAVAAGKRREAATLRAAPPSDRYGRRWLRFFAPTSFVRVSLDDIRRDSTALRGKVIIAGTARGARYASPVGALSDLELLAQTLAGYRTGAVVTTNSWLAILGWSLAGLWIIASGLLMPAGPARLAFPAAGTIGLCAAAAGAFVLAGLWLPVGGPGLLLLTLLGRLSGGRGQRDLTPEARSAQQTLLDGRRLSARGHIAAAWSIYRGLPLSTDRLPETYELACALAARGERRLAAEAFHRIAQVEAGFKDTAQQLLAACADPLLELPDQPQPDMLGRYEILGPIGRGTTGVVYLGHDPSLNRIVAVKAIHLEIEFEGSYVDEARDRFRREAATAGRLAHPSILTIYDIGEEQGVVYIAMEYVRGARLDDYTSPESLLSVEVVLELAARAAEALEYAHRHNVVHRDIKPANIMYDSSTDLLKITDFGIARLMDVSRTRTGIILGTPSYMSPEQLQGKNVNEHTDLFALGVTLYELLTGYLPFRGTSMTDLMFVIANEPHIPVTAIRTDLPPVLDDIFASALAKDPAARFQNGATMARAIRGLQLSISR